MSDIHIKHAVLSDAQEISELNDLAFEERAQSRIISELYAAAVVIFAYVAIKNNVIIGHILFYKITLNGHQSVAELDAVCIHPDPQKQGHGARLIRKGLSALSSDIYSLVFVLGHVSYYLRFGFSSKLGTKFISPWSRPSLMELVLQEKAPTSGTLEFPQAYL